MIRKLTRAISVSCIVIIFSMSVQSCTSNTSADVVPNTTPFEPLTEEAPPSQTQLLVPEVQQTIGDPTQPSNLSTPMTTITQDTSAIGTPSVNDWRITQDVLFDHVPELECELPCWQGLIIGDSDTDQIEEVVGNVFGFGARKELDFNPASPDFLPGVNVSGYQWLFDDTKTFTVRFYVDDSSNLLQGIEFVSYWDSFNDLMTPQRIIQKLGQPSHMLTAVPLSYSPVTSLNLLIVYDIGLVFKYSIVVPVEEVIVNDVSQSIVEVCLDGPLWKEELEPYPSSRFSYITEPFTNGLSDLTPFQTTAVSNIQGADPKFSFAEFFDTSLAEITDLSLQQNNVCFTKDLEDTQ